MNFKETVLKIKKRLERSEFDREFDNVCYSCPFQHKECVEGIANELKKEK